MIGAALGGGLGAFIGSEVDKRQCELSKIQQKYGLDMQVTPLALDTKAANPAGAGNAANTAEKAEPQKVGLSVSVVDQAGKPQFLSGSDQLQPEARAQFSEIARQYSTEQVVAGMGLKSDDEKKKAAEALRKKRVLLIGHTDDTGNSWLNADLAGRIVGGDCEVHPH